MGSSKGSTSNKKYILLMIAAVVIGILLYLVLNGVIDLTTLGQVSNTPNDEEENFAYEELYHPSSTAVIERDDIIVKNFGDELQAQDLESGICVYAADIEDRSENEILEFSEYVGYFYMYDGETLYRTTVNDPDEVRATVKNCLKYEIMGNYIYSLKEHNGRVLLYRCSLIGTYEETLFGDDMEDFWTSMGNLFLKKADGTYEWYNVLTEDKMEHTMPEDAQEISLDFDNIFYFSSEETGEQVLYCRPCNTQEDTALPFESVESYMAAEGNVGVLMRTENGTLQAGWYAATVTDEDETADQDEESSEQEEEESTETETESNDAGADSSEEAQVVIFTEQEFEEGSTVDISSEHLFVTEPDGTTWMTDLDEESWSILFDEDTTEEES